MLRLAIVIVLVALPVAADELEQVVRRVMEHAKKDAAKLKVPVNKHQDELIHAARESANIFNSPGFQKKLQCEQQLLKEELFTDFTKPEQKMSMTGKLAENEKVYFFFSSSIPDETVHTYLTLMEGLEEPGMAMVMKGFVPSERDQYLIRVAKKDRSCVDQLQPEDPVVCDRFEVPIKIQPSLFDRYEITLVPAVVYEREGVAWKITGDAKFDYLLNKINRDAKSPGLERLITALQRAPYE